MLKKMKRSALYPENDTLNDAKAWLLRHRRKGVVCPCCEQTAKVYKRSIRKDMIDTMAVVARQQKQEPFYPTGGRPLVEYNEDGWVYLPEIRQRTRDFATLAYFGLVEQRPGRRPEDGARQGWWRVTEKGYQFLRGQLSVAEYRLVYNGECVGEEGKQVTVENISGKPFDLQRIM